MKRILVAEDESAIRDFIVIADTMLSKPKTAEKQLKNMTNVQAILILLCLI